MIKYDLYSYMNLVYECIWWYAVIHNNLLSWFIPKYIPYSQKKILQVKISGYTASTPRLLYIILWKTSIIAHLDKFISSTSDKVLSMYIHSVDGLGLTPVQLSDLWSIVCLPVANLPVCTSSDDLAFIRSIAYRTEHRVGKYHLTTNKTPVERGRERVSRG